jgi:1-deoxy-D-xylulose-5-phosphate synthase
MVPFCTVYSSFLQRAYDNIIHDVAIERAGVVLCVDRGGVVGEDGTTHQGVFDLAALLPVPNLVIASPMDERDMRNLMFTASRAGVPFVIRYPKGNGPGAEWRGAEFAEIEIGKGRCLREGTDVALLSFGPVGNFAAEAAERAAAEGISVAHYDLRFAKPLDEELLHEVGKKFKRVITVEDGVVRGGVGSAVEDFFSRNGYDVRVEKLGVGDRFVPHGSMTQLYRLCGYDAEGIFEAIAATSSSGRSLLTT